MDILKFSKKLSPRNYFSIILLLLVFPLAKILPPEAGWENGIIENAQVVLLGLSFLSSLELGYYYFGKKAYVFGFLFLLMMARELSWGRVFFPTGRVTEMGPEFISMSSIPGYNVINFCIGVYILAIAVFLYKTVDWKKFFKIPVPAAPVIIAAVALGGQLLSEKCFFDFLTHSRCQIAEELFEAIIYFEFLGTIQYYYAFSYLKDKTGIDLRHGLK